jgi:hypothetical protein
MEEGKQAEEMDNSNFRKLAVVIPKRIYKRSKKPNF